MHIHPGDIVIGLMMVVFAVLGLVLAAGALDIQMTIFGAGLAVFSVAFIFGQIRRHYNTADRARAVAARASHG